MKKHQLDHLLKAAGRITGAREFIVIGSQSLRLVHLPAGDTDGVREYCERRGVSAMELVGRARA